MSSGTLVILAGLAAFLAGCAALAPSELDLQERKVKLEIKAKDLQARVNTAENVDKCRPAIDEAAQREKVLDGALLTAALRGEPGRRDVYSILGKKIKLLEKLDKDLDACIAVS